MYVRRGGYASLSTTAPQQKLVMFGAAQGISRRIFFQTTPRPGTMGENNDRQKIPPLTGARGDRQISLFQPQRQIGLARSRLKHD